MKFNLKNRPDKTLFDEKEQKIISVYETWFEGFEKELREEYKQLNAEINEYIHTDFEAAKYTRIGKYEKITEILGEK